MVFHYLFRLVTFSAIAVAAVTIDGKIKFSSFELGYTLDTSRDEITFSLNSDGKYDWYAFGLHNVTYGGMPNAEVFICNPQTTNLNGVFCQAGNTLKGHTTPTIEKRQYIQLHTARRGPNVANASFSRSLKKSEEAQLSYDIMNKTIMLISASGYWSGKPMPDGSPMRHSMNDYAIANFFEPAE